MERFVCVEDFERESYQKLGENTLEFYTSGADDELTVKDNIDSFSRVLILPRMLRDVSKRDLSTTVLGKKVQVPLGISPSAMQKLAHPDGECGSAKAAESIGGIMVLSMFATSSYDEVAAAASNGRHWLQLYLHKDRSITEGIIRRAEKAGFEAIVFTVDAPYVGKRRVSARNPIQFPPHLRMPNAGVEAVNGEVNLFKQHLAMDVGITFQHISWLKRISKLPVVVKGILRADDARIAVEYGADAIWVSNHGGRQIDTCPAAIDVLPSIIRAVGHTTDVYLDSGVRRGTDIFKALALGAKMVFVGRPALFALAVNGTKGVTKVLEILRDELDLTMALSGVADISSITPDCVCRKDALSKL